MRLLKKLSSVIFLFCICFAWVSVSPFYLPVNSLPCSGAGDEAIFWKFSGGVLGSPLSSDPQNWTFTPGGDQFIAFGTKAGLAVIDLQGRLNWSYATTGPVLCAILVNDLDGDSLKDVVLVIDDQNHPNIIGISSHSCQELWFFTPTVQAVDYVTFEMDDVATRSWDVICVGDIDADGFDDLCVTSWYQMFLLSGKTGVAIWSSIQFFGNDIWKLVVVPNYDLAGGALIVGGSEDGNVLAMDLKTRVEKWAFQIDPSIIYYRDGTQVKSISVPNSIDDLYVVPDVDSDGIADLLISSEDGYVRVFSGDSGSVLVSQQLFQTDLNPSSDPLVERPDTSPFTVANRIYKRFGFRIEVAPDVNNDGYAEFFLTARNLYSYQDICNDIYLISVSHVLTVINSSHLSQIPDQMLYSVACIRNASGIPIYYALTTPGIYSTGTLYKATNLSSLGISACWSESSSGSISEGDLALLGYLLPLGDLTGDGVNELFITTQRGTFGIFDTSLSQMIWSRTIHSRATAAISVNDLNGDGISDLLFKHLGQSQIAWDPFVQKDVIIDLVAVDASNGSVLWRYVMPNFAVYDGLQDVDCVGDVTGDSIPDFAAWIAPAKIPLDISNYIDRLGGSDVLPLTDSTKSYYRSMMANYSRLLLIDGSSGALLWNPPLSSMIYRFARSSNYTGSYENPTSQTSGTYKIANRAPRNPPPGWFNSASTYLYTLTWNRPWNITDLYTPDILEVASGSITGGSVESLGKTTENLTIATAVDGSQWSAIFNLSIPTNLSETHAMGTSEFPLSERERLSAIKFQTFVSLNNTSVAATLSYSLYNFSAGEWVLCNWTDSNKIWDGRFPDLHGDYNRSGAEGGYRSSYSSFSFLQNALRSDVIYVVARGTADSDSAIEFDYENASTLSPFVDSTGAFKLRVNVTDTQPLNVTFNTFGLVPFAWGIAPPHFDAAYIYDTLEDGGYSSFHDDYLLDLDILSFEVINGTGDSHLDVVVVVGPEFLEYYPTTIGSRLVLFDLYNRIIYNRWGTNRSIFPTDFVWLLPLNTSLNAFILSGRFKNSTGSYGTAHVYMKDPRWEHNISQFGNYSLNYSSMEFNWVYSKNTFRYSRSGLGKVVLNNEGEIGLIAGGYGPDTELENISILELESLALIRNIPVSGLFSRCSDSGIDFSLLDIGYILALGCNDFNQDGWLDHIGLYRPESGSGLTNNTFVVYSGNPLDLDNGGVLSTCTVHTSLIGYEPSDIISSIPFGLPGDLDGDGLLDLCVGIDSKQAICQGANISYNDLGVDGETSKILYDWELEPSKCSTNFAAIDFVQSMIATRDFTADGKNEFLINHNQFLERGGTQLLEPYHISELLDVHQKRLLFRFTTESTQYFDVSDINADSVDDFCILMNNAILCVNARFGVNFTNIESGQQMLTAKFSVEWSSSILGAKFELLVDGISHGYTNSYSMFLSLGEGLHNLQVLMYDASGIVMAMDSIDVQVPTEYNLAIGTGVVIGGLICIYAYLQYRHKKAWSSAKKILARRKKKNA